MKVRVRNNLEELSSYDKKMEEFVSTKKDRIIEVYPVDIQGVTYYKCNELDYWYFTEFMIEQIEDVANTKIILDKETVLRNFFLHYGVEVNGSLFDSSKKEIEKYLDGCTYLSCVSGATSIGVDEFYSYGVKFFSENKYEDIVEEAFAGIETLS